MDFNLKKTLWAVLLASGDIVTPKKFQEFVHRVYPERFLALSELRVAVEELNIELAAREAPERISEGPEGFFIRLTPDYADCVRSYKGEPKPQKLTAAAMETLAIIAYRQPITRSQMEAIRGVACDGPVGKLMELELVECRQNEELPGRPMMYSTSAKFLEMCGLKSLEELPQTQESENERLKEFFKKHEQQAAEVKVEEATTEVPAATSEAPAQNDVAVAVATEAVELPQTEEKTNA